MKRTFRDRLRGWLRGHQAGTPTDRDIDALVRDEARRLHAMDPDTHRRWQMLRNTLSAAPQHQYASGSTAPSRMLRPALIGGILVSAAMMVFVLWKTAPVPEQRFVTGRGQMSTITLADSSDVLLNHTSEVQVAPMVAGEMRRVTLHGEAFFKVRKNGSPFQVQTAAGTVEVLGTEFNVRERPGAFEVAVVSGRVRVRVPRNGGDRTVELTHGMVVMVADGDTLLRAQQIRFDPYPGWMHNRLIFQDTPLASVCEELEARFDCRVKIVRSTAARERISGTLEGRSAEQALTSLGALTGLSLRHDTDAYILY